MYSKQINFRTVTSSVQAFSKKLRMYREVILKKHTALLLILSCTVVSAQTIEKFSIDSGGASVSNGSIQVLYTIGEVNVQEVSTASMQLSEGFINADLKIKVNPKLFLQGASLNPEITGLMNDDLRTLGYIPTTSPYQDDRTCNASVFNTTGNDAIVDWVWVELRAANDNQKRINARSALLQRDGDVVDVDGVSSVLMTAPPTNYYIVVHHRNHLGVMSNNGIALQENTTTSVDFTDVSLATYGSHARVLLANGTMALWAGETNNASYIKFSGANNSTNIIKDFVLADPSNGFNSVTYPSSGYLLIDVDMDGQGKFSGANNDSNIIKDNVLSHPANGFGSSTYTIQATVPVNN